MCRVLKLHPMQDSIRDTGKITLFKSAGRLRTVRIAANIRKMKHRHDRLQVFSYRKIARDLRISRVPVLREFSKMI